MLSEEATNTNFVVFGVTSLRIEPAIYYTWGEQANHYTTDAILQRINQSVVLDKKDYNRCL